ncbi:hypothetical protein EYF80_052442 [Liparis tanakae]|uniref:Uncharacterized protein n=1 Tax=Liparis tanakae TaxID=230148 RepID=A0A4Z2F932_9TELE|nr:hypothetical protein EYF80_052442 [Liparis tanakae]
MPVCTRAQCRKPFISAGASSEERSQIEQPHRLKHKERDVSRVLRILTLQGQLGLGDDRIQSSAPRLLHCSQLAEVTRIQAGGSYSAAVTGGELLLWGRVPRVSRVVDHPGLEEIWTPQPVSLAAGKVCDVACGSWHMMALTTKSRQKNTQRVRSEREAGFGDRVSAPLLMEHAGKEKPEQCVKDLVVSDMRGLCGALPRRGQLSRGI